MFTNVWQRLWNSLMTGVRLLSERCSRCRTSVIPRLHKDMKYWKWDFVLTERKKMHDWKASLKGLHYKHSDFPLQEKSYTEPELHNKANRLRATYLHQQGSWNQPSWVICAQGKVLSRKEIYLASLRLHGEAGAAIISIRHFSGPLNLITYWSCSSGW